VPTVPDSIFRRFVRVNQAAGIATFHTGAAPPRSRAPQPTLEFGRDGSVTVGVPGPADARVPRTGRWEPGEGGTLTLRWDDGGDEAVVEVLASEADVLELRIVSGSLETGAASPGGG